MGNSRSQPCRRGRPLYLLYLIHRTWSVVVEHRGKEERFDDTDRDTDVSSKCSGCRDCTYRQEGTHFDSESDMAPNAEEELLVVKPWGPQPEKERLRPPTYNAEDYAVALRRWGRRPLGPLQDSQGTLPSTTSSSSGYASGNGEMTLRQFTSVSELLNKLRADLRLAFPSFVQEFASPPADGITLLLETLRGIQLVQNSPPSGQIGPKVGTRRAALDELGCVECLAACMERCTDAPRLLVQAQPGLLALAVCLTSSLNRSRVLALQLLTKVCKTPGGHAIVSEAVSTLRLRYGEGGRFRFLAGALLAPRAAVALRVAGISFLNAFLKSAPRAQTRLYIQAEACEAGLEPKALQEWLTDVNVGEEDTLTDLLHKEVQRWGHNCVDVEALQKRAVRAEETCRILGKKISALQSQLQKLQLANLNGYNLENVDTTKTTDFNEQRAQRVSSNAEDEGISSSERSSSPEELKQGSRQGRAKVTAMDNDQETTIDDVIEELRIIVKDAEEEFEDKNARNNSSRAADQNVDLSCDNAAPECAVFCRTDSKLSLNSDAKAYLLYADYKGKSSSDTKDLAHNSRVTESNANSSVFHKHAQNNPVTYFGARDRDRASNSSATQKLDTDRSSGQAKLSADGSLKIEVNSPEIEEAIVPAIIHPQPPRRSPPCLSAILAAKNCNFVNSEEVYNSHDEEVEEETLGDGSDSLLSASRLKYNTRNSHLQEARMKDTNVVTERLDEDQRGANVSYEVCGERMKMKLAKSFDNLRDFETTNDGRQEKKTIRNYDVGSRIKSSLDHTGSLARHVDVYNKQLDRESIPKQSKNTLNSGTEHVQRHGSKYKSEIEKRKYLRRAASQDLLSSNNSSPYLKRSGSKIEGRIRKFESLNSFDSASLQNFTRLGSMDSINRQSGWADNNSKSKMRRSESFHHVSQAARKDQCSSSHGGSDSGLFYVTDFDLEPVASQKLKSEMSKSPSPLTKSLDRIDEGLDSMVDVIITEEKQHWGFCKRLRSDKQMTSAKSRVDSNETRGKSGRLQYSDSNCSGREKPSARNKLVLQNKQLKNDELYNNCDSSKQLRSDELYDDGKLHGRNQRWSYQNELNDLRKSKNLNSDNPLVIMSRTGPRHNSFCYDKGGGKISSRTNESSIFLPSGRPCDVFGLGKNRFNAGKYSGNQLPKESINGRRNSAVSFTGKRGKVTDILSGLY